MVHRQVEPAVAAQARSGVLLQLLAMALHLSSLASVNILQVVARAEIGNSAGELPATQVVARAG